MKHTVAQKHNVNLRFLLTFSEFQGIKDYLSAVQLDKLINGEVDQRVCALHNVTFHIYTLQTISYSKIIILQPRK